MELLTNEEQRSLNFELVAAASQKPDDLSTDLRSCISEESLGADSESAAFSETILEKPDEVITVGTRPIVESRVPYTFRKIFEILECILENDSKFQLLIAYQ